MNRICLDKNEKLVLEKHYRSILPMVLLVIGVAFALIGFVFGLVLLAEEEDPSLFSASFVGVVLIILGSSLRKKCEMLLTVTNKRVCLTGPSQNFVYLPLGQIDSVSIKGNALHIASASGRIVVPGGEDSVGVCNALMGLLNQLQAEVTPPVKLPVVEPKSEPQSAPKMAQPKPEPKPEPVYDLTGYIGKKWCSGCGTVLPKDAVVCSDCGSKYLNVITEEDAKSVLINSEELEGMDEQTNPNSTPICKCGAIPNRVGNQYVCPVCCRKFS